ncbi:restriction endonuclease subunit S [Ligilactobacillus acidipiscis]|uniref:restriction endonuclease subunit S n=1 Tax=Ligilactobacillus acidipiscis TaxID=89059 RepID=UPI0023F7BE6B|nr:restriction endonuclease subunit S [Ligilactobacillus acidipiscis]WEV57896.1 restriction endonuclease subunit S [Ligilactobacillus acidipiscis]
MSGKQKNVPYRRFKEFENADDWEQRKLGEIGKTFSGIGFPENEQGGTEGIPFFKVSDMNNVGNEHEMNSANNYVSNNQLKRKKWKVINNVPGVIFAKVGAAIMLNRKRLVRVPFLIDNNTMEYAFDDSWDTYFGQTLFETINLPRYAQVGALPSYNGSDIETISIEVPNKNEQERIGSFFKRLDHLITLHQRKYDKLKKLKSAYLSEMFPAEGERKPKRRFAGFTDDWEQRKLGELYRIYSGQTPFRGDSTNFEHPTTAWIKTTDLNNTIITQNEENISDKAAKKMKILPVATILVAMYGGFNQIGRTGMLSYPSTINQAISALPPIKTVDPYFLITQLNSRVSEWKRLAASSRKDPNITKKDVADFRITYPSLSEQKIIGNFFNNLDHLITLHQQQLEKLKKLKQAYLNEMFV